MSNLFNTYIPKFIVDLNRPSGDITFVSTSYFAPDGDVYLLDKRTVNTSVIQTQQSIQELVPDVSTQYPFKIVIPLDVDGSNILQVPSLAGIPTASQHYYAPMWFERYNTQVINLLDKNFTELYDATSLVDLDISSIAQLETELEEDRIDLENVNVNNELFE
jgi:hypothetical protein